MEKDKKKDSPKEGQALQSMTSPHGEKSQQKGKPSQNASSEGVTAEISTSSEKTDKASSEDKKESGPQTSDAHGQPSGPGDMSAHLVVPPTQHVASRKKSSNPLVEHNFEQQCLDAHNAYRLKHQAQPLKISPVLSEYAKEWAIRLSLDDDHKVRGRPDCKYGENLFTIHSTNPKHLLGGSEPVDSWYSGAQSFVFGKEPATTSVPFTQVVWKETKEMGVGYATSKSGRIFVVAYYDPPGNVIGKFTGNVLPAATQTAAH